MGSSRGRECPGRSSKGSHGFVLPARAAAGAQGPGLLSHAGGRRNFDKSARVVMVSALGKEELVKKSLLLGAKNYIIKPLDRKKVLERIAACLK